MSIRTCVLMCLLVSLSRVAVLRAQDAAASDPPINSQLIVQSGDLLEVSTFDIPELSRMVRVDSDGDVNLPLLGLVHAAGRTAGALGTEIDKELKDRRFVRDPNTSVFIKEYATQGVSVMGEVAHPGVYQMLGPRRLLDVLAQAGGFQPSAAAEARIQHRGSQGSTSVLISPTNGKIALENNPYLLPGDTVLISKAPVVYVIGDVVRPGGYTMQNDGRLSLLQALSLAGGPTHTASSRKAQR